MAKATLKTDNIHKPAPKWYRQLRIVVYSLFVTALFSDTLQRLGLSDADVNYCTGWLIAIVETLGKLLANGEEYSSVNKK